MAIEKFEKREIALRQIETALELYWRQADLFSVITLAGAAEEILGQLLPEPGGKERQGDLLTSIFSILRPKQHRGISGQERTTSVHMDPQVEARFLLRRAIEDYAALAGAPTETMRKFLDEAS